VAPTLEVDDVVTAPGATLTRVTVKVRDRWIDVALPGDVPLGELLPYLLRHAGEDAADAGERHAGWLLRRSTGESLELDQTLAASKVPDGELLHLVPGEVEWPELEYEDLVETIASGARRYGRSWSNAATRRAGLAVAGAVLTAGLLTVPLLRSPWLPSGLVLLAVGAGLLAAGVLVARAIGDARAGAVFAAVSLPYGFVGGYLLTGPAHAGLTEFGAGQVLLGLTMTLLFGLAGYLGVPVAGRLFTAAITASLLGMLAAVVTGRLGTDGAAALVLTVGIGLLPAYPLVAIRLGRLPLPILPQRAADLLTDDPPPPTPEVFAAAARTDELLTGLLTGMAVSGTVAVAVLAGHGGTAQLLLVLTAGIALLLRARLFPIPRQRLPLLIAGLLTVAALVGTRVVAADGNGPLLLWLLALVAVGLLTAFLGLSYSRRRPSPYLGRIGDIVDVLAILALVPLTGFITGLFGYVQGLLAGVL
jgi:type VII secretion integral membrane protein EccD